MIAQLERNLRAAKSTQLHKKVDGLKAANRVLNRRFDDVEAQRKRYSAIIDAQDAKFAWLKHKITGDFMPAMVAFERVNWEDGGEILEDGDSGVSDLEDQDEADDAGEAEADGEDVVMEG